MVGAHEQPAGGGSHCTHTALLLTARCQLHALLLASLLAARHTVYPPHPPRLGRQVGMFNRSACTCTPGLGEDQCKSSTRLPKTFGVIKLKCTRSVCLNKSALGCVYGHMDIKHVSLSSMILLALSNFNN